jgi:glycosyltransferase involved in cell wall biosynthesis
MPTAHRQVVLAHDYLTQRGGAERVALEIARVAQVERIVTSIYERDATYQGFEDFSLRSSFLQRIATFRRDPRRALPLLGWAWSSQKPVDADILICSSSGWSHGVRATSRTRKVVYCYNPPRWLYQPDDYLAGQPVYVKVLLALLRPALTRWDKRAAKSADLYIAISTSVAERIRSTYGVEPALLFPPVAVTTEGEREPVTSVAPGYFLTVARDRGYKGTQTLVEAFAGLPDARLVIVGSSPHGDLPANVTALGRVSEGELRWLYENARALASVSREDFGLTPLEANAFGTPALLIRAGGFLDTTLDGTSGRFIEEPTVESVQAAVLAFPDEWDADAIRAHAESFSVENFGRRLMELCDAPEARP